MKRHPHAFGRRAPKRAVAPVRVLHAPHIDRCIVEHAERLLAEARAGRIRSLCIVGSFNGNRDVFRATRRNGDVFIMLGALEWAKQQFLDDIEPG